jgi:hypothetical protein
VLGSTKPIRGLKATLGELKRPSGILPASALELRYAVSGGVEYGVYSHTYGFGTGTGREVPRASALGALLDAAPAECPVVRAGVPHVGGEMMLGWFSDTRAKKEELKFWREVTGDLPWVSHAHFKTTQFGNSEKLGFKTGYMTSVHDVDFPEDPAKKRKYGWKNPVLHAHQYVRVGWQSEMQMLPGSMWQSLTEINIAGNQRGFGRLGGDYWAAIKDKNGRRVAWPHQRYPWSTWGMLEMQCSVLAAGPEGAVATNRFEQIHEGVEQCEARICIESALTDEAKRRKLGEDLASRCQAALDERILYALRGVSQFQMSPHFYVAPWTWKFQTGETGHAWFQSTGWRERKAKLFALAGEVEKKLAAK